MVSGPYIPFDSARGMKRVDFARFALDRRDCGLGGVDAPNKANLGTRRAIGDFGLRIGDSRPDGRGISNEPNLPGPGGTRGIRSSKS